MKPIRPDCPIVERSIRRGAARSIQLCPNRENGQWQAAGALPCCIRLERQGRVLMKVLFRTYAAE